MAELTLAAARVSTLWRIGRVLLGWLELPDGHLLRPKKLAAELGRYLGTI